ncbi:beta clamp domain-containing protein [Paraburkholderia bannensis]|uniref:hypothetical protein n=1 Tax=Paraburkholderia bannensis TaxID=765414 RepID=UPI002AB7BFDF|nr:hypothetical protein [Paraburkholderia bannensis]
MNATTDHEQLSIEGVPAAETPDSNSAPSMIARVNALAVKIAFPFMAKDDIRFYLNGLNIRPLADDSVMIVATDGHRFVVIHDQNGYAERELIVSIKKDCLKSATSKATFDAMSSGSAFVNDEHGMPVFVQPGSSLIDAEFPRIENVVSAAGYSEGISGAINPAYLKDALTIGQNFNSIRFFTKDQDSALLFVVGGMGDLEVFGGIMKLRESFEQLPTWFPPPSPFKLTEPVA